jgi:hypothetical protein
MSFSVMRCGSGGSSFRLTRASRNLEISTPKELRPAKERDAPGLRNSSSVRPFGQSSITLIRPAQFLYFLLREGSLREHSSTPRDWQSQASHQQVATAAPVIAAQLTWVNRQGLALKNN